jgi:hypothetical protein
VCYCDLPDNIQRKRLPVWPKVDVSFWSQTPLADDSVRSKIFQTSGPGTKKRLVITGFNVTENLEIIWTSFPSSVMLNDPKMQNFHRDPRRPNKPFGTNNSKYSLYHFIEIKLVEICSFGCKMHFCDKNAFIWAFFWKAIYLF